MTRRDLNTKGSWVGENTIHQHWLIASVACGIAVLCATATLAVVGCIDKNLSIVSPNPVGTTVVEISPAQYTTNQFFVDTLYRKFFEPLHASVVPQLTDEMLSNCIVQIDVYLSVLGISESDTTLARAYIDLPAHEVGQPYLADDISHLDKVPGRYEYGRFKLLDSTKDYRVDRYGGIITLLRSFSDFQAITVAYTIAGSNGQQKVYGTPRASAEPGDTLILKLIKPQNLRSNPSYHPAWELMLKNIYRIPGTGQLTKNWFELAILRRAFIGPDQTEFANHTFLEIFGLDRYDNFNTPTPDNVFDFIPGLTVDPDRREIIFPALRPFDSTIVHFFNEKLGTQAPDSLLVSSIYDTTALAAHYDIKNRYTIVAKYYTPSR